MPALAAGPMPLASADVETVRDAARCQGRRLAGADGRGRGALSGADRGDRPFHPAMERLEALDAGNAKGALTERIAALRAIAKPIGWDITLTLDPTERHGFEYQSWFGFSVFAEGFIGEIGPGRRLSG